MNIEVIKVESIQLLNEFYQLDTQAIPPERSRSEWKADNKRGFFLGIIREGEDSHIIQLHTLLAGVQFSNQQTISTTDQRENTEHSRSFIDDMFDYYILS